MDYPLFHSSSMMLDLYQLTMAQGFWKSNRAQRRACFHLNFRRSPFNGSLTIAAGLASVIEALKQFSFTQNDLAYLSTLKNYDDEPLFDREFLQYLSILELSLDIDAVQEGEVIFPYEPLVRVQGPLLECQLIETLLLNTINFQTLIATKAARLSIAAQGGKILELGFRRAQGIDGALSASRAAYIGGCSATSNVLAGKVYGIPVAGTMGHSWVMAFEDEDAAFSAYADAMPAQSVFLVDTYHTLKGVVKAIEKGKELEEKGHRFLGVRLDSGDLAYLSQEARKLLDAAGFKKAQVIASNELDEMIIRDLLQQGAQINVWGVGTNLVTSKGQPALDGVYKLSALQDENEHWEYKIKCSEQMLKTSNPGILQVRRYFNENRYLGDAIYDTLIDSKKDFWSIVDPLDPTKKKRLGLKEDFRDLLVPIYRKGKCVYTPPTLNEIKQKVERELSFFHQGLKRFIFPHQYPFGLEQSLYETKIQLIEKVRNQHEQCSYHH